MELYVSTSSTLCCFWNLSCY